MSDEPNFNNAIFKSVELAKFEREVVMSEYNYRIPMMADALRKRYEEAIN